MTRAVPTLPQSMALERASSWVKRLFRFSTSPSGVSRGIVSFHKVRKKQYPLAFPTCIIIYGRRPTINKQNAELSQYKTWNLYTVYIMLNESYAKPPITCCKMTFTVKTMKIPAGFYKEFTIRILTGRPGNGTLYGVSTRDNRVLTISRVK